ncbi:MAG: 4-alpha-glucanotransferase [Gammaproteobacteria bacterium]|nr:4-alpha-glucanotransferase [Gammaproteobacteria bacterium]MDH3363334.1 4-alpha-glucanotransferase [Gammaproteobacteria bacterium]MDH3480901.1 4-alpha-glucanotransferase [Gammaproteobacteria bacterium]
MNPQDQPTTSDTEPPILPTERRAGVCLHIASLPGPCGIGEIGAEARAFVDKMRDMHLGVWQFLPTGPTAYGDSPYQPLSTFAGNEMLISIGDLVDMGLLVEHEVEELAKLPTGFVDYGALIPGKNRLLDTAARRFPQEASDEVQARCAAFIAANDAAWLHDYALFRILKTRHGERPWPEWTPEYVHRDEQALKDLEVDEAATIGAIKVIQFLFDHQWQRFRNHANASGILLFGDMPIYIALDSSDAWANRDILRLGEDGQPDCVAGVPPDYFSEDGQLWGNPLYDWAKHAANGYRWWIDRLQASAKLTDLVRIDHFRGFEAFWSIPADSATARVGAWEPGPGDAIFDAMKASLGVLPIVAEDLGVITPEVEALRDRHHIPGMRVLQFDVCDDDFALSDVGRNSVCYTGTHDNDTTIGWFHGSPGDIRSAEEIERTQKAVLDITGGTPETIHNDLIKAAFSTEAQLAIAPMQDYLGLGSEARLNTPGKPGGNWRWRVTDAQLTRKVCDNVADMVRASGRELTH